MRTINDIPSSLKEREENGRETNDVTYLVVKFGSGETENAKMDSNDVMETKLSVKWKNCKTFSLKINVIGKQEDSSKTKIRTSEKGHRIPIPIRPVFGKLFQSGYLERMWRNR